MPASARHLSLLFLTSLSACGLAPASGVPHETERPVGLVIEPDAGPEPILDLLAKCTC